MRRTQIQLTDEMYERLRRRAFEQGCSLSSVVRALLEQGMAPPEGSVTTPDWFTFVGSSRSEQGDLAPVSERHDEAWPRLE